MAVYVTSDAHGHLRAFDEVLEKISLGSSDTLFVLGDMVDRGPDPLGVVKLVRSLPNAHVLLGNHEHMMLDAVAHLEEKRLFGLIRHESVDLWALNGGFTTLEGLDSLDDDEFQEIVDWVRALPLYFDVRLGDREYLLVHAGINPEIAAPVYAETGSIDEAMAAQTIEDVVWIRAPFWSQPTGLIDRFGNGPVVIAGHTPTILLNYYVDHPCEPMTDEEGRGKIVEVGATWDTGGVPDRINIDCSAAAGAGQGRVGILRLDDGARFYAAIKSGE